MFPQSDRDGVSEDKPLKLNLNNLPSDNFKNKIVPPPIGNTKKPPSKNSKSNSKKSKKSIDLGPPVDPLLPPYPAHLVSENVNGNFTRNPRYGSMDSLGTP